MKVVISTCDAYAHSVPLALKCLERHFPAAIVEVVYSNIKPEGSGVYWIKLLKDEGWIKNMWTYCRTTFALDNGPFVLLMDDYMLVDHDKDLLRVASEQIARPDVALVRLVPTPGPTLPWDTEFVGEIDKTSEYSLSLQATLWQPKALQIVCEYLLNMGATTAWDFELRGSEEVKSWDVGTFLGLTKSAVSYDNYIRRGKIVPAVHERLVANGTLSQ